jgi:hypothetical protein
VMYWWDAAAALARAGRLRRFGLITTNSITQSFSRRVLQSHLSAQPPLSIVFAVPDHPWVDTANGAAVRIAMTVAAAGVSDGVLARMAPDNPRGQGEESIEELSLVHGRIQADLTVGAAITSYTAVDLSYPRSQPKNLGWAESLESKHICDAIETGGI